MIMVVKCVWTCSNSAIQMAIVLPIICSDYNLSFSCHKNSIVNINLFCYFSLLFFSPNSHINKSFEFFWIDIKITFRRKKKRYAWMCKSYNVTNSFENPLDNITLLCKYGVCVRSDSRTLLFSGEKKSRTLKIESENHILFSLLNKFCVEKQQQQRSQLATNMEKQNDHMQLCSARWSR